MPIAIRFNLPQFCSSQLTFVFAVSAKPSFNVLSNNFYVSIDLEIRIFARRYEKSLYTAGPEFALLLGVSDADNQI